jgi:rare lipoprotein A
MRSDVAHSLATALSGCKDQSDPDCGSVFSNYILFLIGKGMNQHRWTCLTTLVFTTVLAPLATVNAKTLTALTPVSDREVPLASRVTSQSLPIVTPLNVTELQTDVAVPTVNRVVPTVSKLPLVKPASSPIVKPIAATSTQVTDRGRFSLQEQLPVAEPYPDSVSETKFAPTNISFNSQLKAIEPIVGTLAPVQATKVAAKLSTPATKSQAATPGKTSAVKPTTPRKLATAQLSTPVVQPPATTSFTTSKVAPPISIVGDDGKPSAQIVNSATVRAEIATAPQPVPSVAPLDSSIAPSTYRPETLPVPQPAPIIATSTDRAELPNFEAGAPVFIFDNERPQQIVTTTIAQIGGETVAAEPSIAIPVERPKQDAIPPQSLVPVKPTQQPQVKNIVTIEQPTETIQPAIDKIVVSTHTGKASWYGSEGGSRTANGERYNPNGMTAAHRTLPFGTKVRVTSLKTGKSAIVRINDRGPFIRNRIIDVSAATAAAIGIKGDGIGEVKMEVLADDV